MNNHCYAHLIVWLDWRFEKDTTCLYMDFGFKSVFLLKGSQEFHSKSFDFKCQMSSSIYDPPNQVLKID